MTTADNRPSHMRVKHSHRHRVVAWRHSATYTDGVTACEARVRSSSGEHYVGLDHVRALAALMVFSWHFIHGFDGSPVPFASLSLFFPFSIIDEGHTGVALFMTLSGYLFAKIIGERQIAYGPFFWNRFLRLIPLLIVVEMVHSLLDNSQGVPFSTFYNLVFQGLVFPTLPYGAWSVTVEFQFYLLLPFILVIFRSTPRAALILISGALLARLVILAHNGEVQSLAYWTIVGRFDQFVLGVTFGRASGAMKRKHGLAAAIALAFALIYFIFDRSGGFYKLPSYPSPSLVWIVLPTIEGAAYASLIAYYDRTFSMPNRGLSGLIGRAGAYSYSIYLLHVFVVFWAASYINAHIQSLSNRYVAELWAVGCFCLMIPVGHLSFVLIESPFLRWRRPYVRIATNERSQTA